MGARGRKSLAGLAVVPVSGRRMPPPEHLTPPQAEEWRQIVDSLPADYFRPGDAPLLAAFCVASAFYKKAAQMMEEEGLVLEDDRGRRQAHPAASILTTQASSMAQMSVKLRLAPSSRYSEKQASTKAGQAGRKRPWDDDEAVG